MNIDVDKVFDEIVKEAYDDIITDNEEKEENEITEMHDEFK